MKCLANPSWSMVHIITAVRAALSLHYLDNRYKHAHDPAVVHSFQALATLNAVGLAFAVWRDRRELNFVEAIVAGRNQKLGSLRSSQGSRPLRRLLGSIRWQESLRRAQGAGAFESKQRRAHARWWRVRRTLPSGANQANPPVAPVCPLSGQKLPGNHQVTRRTVSMRDEQMTNLPPPGSSVVVPLPRRPSLSAAPLPPPMLSSPHLSSPLPSPLPSPPDGDVRDGTNCPELVSSEAGESSKFPSVRLSDVALAEGSGVWDEEKDLMRGIVRAGNGTILSQMGPEVSSPMTLT